MKVLPFAVAWFARSGHGDDSAIVEFEATRGLLQSPGDELVGGEFGLPRLLHRARSILSILHPTTAVRFARPLANRDCQLIGEMIATSTTRRSKFFRLRPA